MRYFVTILLFILPAFNFAQPAAGTRQIDSINAHQITAGIAIAGQVLGYDGSIWKPVAAGGYTLPIATDDDLGGFMVGNHLFINPSTGKLDVVADIYESSVSVIASGNTFVSAAKTGDVESPQNSNVMTIANNAITTAKVLNGAITDAKLANMAAHTVKVNNTASVAAPTNMTVNASSFVGRGSTGSLTNLTSADMTFSGATFVIANNAINTAKIANSAVTLAKLANLSQGQFIGRYGSGSGVPQTMSFNPSHFSLNTGTGVVSAIGGGGGSQNLFEAPDTMTMNIQHNMAGYTWSFLGKGGAVGFGAWDEILDEDSPLEDFKVSANDISMRSREIFTGVDYDYSMSAELNVRGEDGASLSSAFEDEMYNESGFAYVGAREAAFNVEYSYSYANGDARNGSVTGDPNDGIMIRNSYSENAAGTYEGILRHEYDETAKQFDLHISSINYLTDETGGGIVWEGGTGTGDAHLMIDAEGRFFRGTGGSQNLFAANATLLENRSHDLGGFSFMFGGLGSIVSFGNEVAPISSFNAITSNSDFSQFSLFNVGTSGVTMTTTGSVTVNSDNILLTGDVATNGSLNNSNWGGTGDAHLMVNSDGFSFRGPGTIINTSLSTTQTSSSLNAIYTHPAYPVQTIVIAPNVGSGMMYIKITSSTWVSSALTGI